MNFSYTEVPIPDGAFKISPSSIDKFFSYPSIWYKEQILKEKDFIASTATVLGTVIHAIAEAVATNQPVDREACDKYIMEQALNPNLTNAIDIGTIQSLYPEMAERLVNDYILANPPTEAETSLKTQLTDNVWVAGTCDNRTNDIIVDYKNVGKKPTNLDTIPFNYKIQLLTYAYMYKHAGVQIERIRIVYTIRPTKTIGVRVIPVTEVITAEDWTLVENTLQLMAETIETTITNPELIHLLYKSMSLKEH